MKIILSVSGIVSAILLGVVMALALSHPNNSLSNVNNTAQRGINLLVPHEPWGFGRGEVTDHQSSYLFIFVTYVYGLYFRFGMAQWYKFYFHWR